MTSRELVQKLLPTCQRCRRLRRKCDTQLPACRLCQKAGAECTLFDHALQQSLPRAYVQSLLTRLEHLKAVKDTLETSPNGPLQCSPISTHQHHHTTSIASIQTTQYPEHQTPEDQPPTSLDKHFPISSHPQRSRFFGASSVFTLSVSVLHHASSKGIISSDYSPPSPLSGTSNTQPEQKQHLAYESYGQPEAVRAHCRLYFVSSNVLYGIVDQTACDVDLDLYFRLRSQRINGSTLHGPAAHTYFRISMICAISCATMARHDSKRGAESMAYYHDALPCVEEVTSEVGAESLQALLLLTVFLLFYPREGDIWKVLDYACRLCVELGYHTESSPDFSDGMIDEVELKLRGSTFWGLYAIERITGQLFGRVSDLPESIITISYPSSLPFIQPQSPTSHSSTALPISIGHHYRLVYLRSELFKALYLPAVPLTYDWSWYKDRCATLCGWKEGLKGSESEGVARTTCEVGYHSTMCFIFQPVMLRALKATESECEDGMGQDVKAVPQDNYYSAIALLKTYEKVIRAKESSPLGIYPMTFLSAHYIYLAGLTLMAHALLALDGRLEVLKKMEDLEFDADGNPESEKLSWTGFWEASNTCLVLLQWCAERWLGMEGMRDIYLKVAGRVLPEMARKGLLS